MKFDRNLEVVREELVPDEISEDDFWQNYFYAVECVKKVHGLPSNIGEKLGETERLAAVNEEIQKLNEEVKEAKEPTAKAVAGDKAEVELQPMTKEKPNEESKEESKLNE